MLEELSIQNIALIEEAHLEFTSGLNVLSGETGAGKSILLGALGLLLGDKADKSLIRRGAGQAAVSGVLQVRETPELMEWFESQGIEPGQESLIIRRTLKEEGRSSIFVQGQAVTTQSLKELSSLLFDIHGQHQHQSLFVVDHHRRLLDRYGNLEERVQNFSNKFRELKELKEELRQRDEEKEQRLRDRELAEFALQEITEAQLKPGEDQSLLERLKRMEQKEELAAQFQTFQQRVQGEQGLLLDLKQLQSNVEALSVLDKAGDNSSERFNSLYYELEDLAEHFSSAMAGFDFSPAEQQKLEERLALIHSLEKKYTPGVEALIHHAEELQQDLQQQEAHEEEDLEKHRHAKELEDFILSEARAISEVRSEVGSTLEAEVESHLQALGMSSAQFKISLQGRTNAQGSPSCGPTGCDRVEFLLSANRGEELHPLKAVASGGELSRIMLAIKTAFAKVDPVETLVFDEIDSGVGGQVALAIGEHFRKLSRNKQIFCITHLASIASFADNQIKVSKTEGTERTLTEVRPLKGQEREIEIARMLAGDSQGSLSLEHAKELLQQNSPGN